MPKKGVVPPALRAWSDHLQEYRRKHPKLSMKEAMKGASKTYRKGPNKVEHKGGSMISDWMIKHPNLTTGIGIGLPTLLLAGASLARGISGMGRRRHRRRKGGIIAPTNMWGNIRRPNSDGTYGREHVMY